MKGSLRTPVVLLINPWIIDFKAFDLWMKPLGLLYISSVLKKNGFDVRLIDCMDRFHPSVADKVTFRNNGTGKFFNTETQKPEPYKGIPRKYKQYGIPTNEFIKEIENIPEPSAILVTSIMTYWYPGVHKAIRIVKEVFPGVPVILGGIYATLCRDFAIENSGADVVFSGGDFDGILRLISDITGRYADIIPGRPDGLPYPDLQTYRDLSYGVILTTLGCPYNCSYCASSVIYDGFSRRSPGKVIKELIHIRESLGQINATFYDDALLVSQNEHIKPILRGLIECCGDSIHLHTPNGLHARFIDIELAFLMKKAGFETIRLGLETSDEKALKDSGDKVNKRQLETAVHNLLNAGFTSREVAVYLMMGVPGQTAKEVDDSVEFVHSLGVQSRVSDYSPVPMTRDFERMPLLEREQLEDPLYQNNTYRRYRGAWESYEIRRELLQKSESLNREVQQ